jgi:hypothetical protein
LICLGQNDEIETESNQSSEEINDFSVLNEDKEGYSDLVAVIDRDTTDVADEIGNELVKWTGFKIVCDNVDRVVKSRFMRIDRQNRILNYCNAYGVLDRIDLSSYCSFKTTFDTNVQMDELLPSPDVQEDISRRMSVIVARILVETMPAFQFYFEDVVEHHINHMYSKEMGMKSEVVCIHSLSL